MYDGMYLASRSGRFILLIDGSLYLLDGNVDEYRPFLGRDDKKYSWSQTGTEPQFSVHSVTWLKKLLDPFSIGIFHYNGSCK
jgi:hypothetical protein